LDTSQPEADSTAFTKLAQCVDDVRRTLKFPAPGDGIVTVSYPLEFAHTPSL
jgi:hypothetical protein